MNWVNSAEEYVRFCHWCWTRQNWYVSICTLFADVFETYKNDIVKYTFFAFENPRKSRLNWMHTDLVYTDLYMYTDFFWFFAFSWRVCRYAFSYFNVIHDCFSCIPFLTRVVQRRFVEQVCIKSAWIRRHVYGILRDLQIVLRHTKFANAIYGRFEAYQICKRFFFHWIE